MLTVSPIYAGLLALLLIWLSANVIRHRFRARVSVGDGGDAGLIKAIRAQANFTEYTPIALVLLAMAELQAAPSWALHLLGATLLLGRVLHAWGFSHSPQIVKARQAGVVLTFTMIIVTALADITHALV